MAWYNNLFNRSPKKSQPLKRRGYTAASGGRLFSDFYTTSTSADAEIKNNLRILRDRARDLARNDPYVNRYLNLMISNVVGHHGIKISSKARNDDGSLDMLANQKIELAFKQWSQKGNCTLNGRFSFLDCQKMFIEALARDGEVLVRHIKTNSNPFGYALQFLESDHLDEKLNDTNPKTGNKIKMGIEYDKNDKAIAYHLYKEHPYDQAYYNENKYIRIPASEIIHAYIPTRPEQRRGVTMIAPAMPNLKMLNGYLEAEIVAARVSASKMGFFTSPDGDGYVGEDYMNEFSPIMNASAGTFEQLPAGMDFKAFDPNHPNSAFENFTTQVLRSIASGLNISYHALTNDLTSINYSSIRHGALEDRAMFQIYQQFVIEHFMKPIFYKWFDMAIASGMVSLPISKFDKFFNSITFIPRSWSWIDPLKEQQANVAGLSAGITTYADISAAYGRDPEELFEQHEREAKLAEQYGIKTAFQPFGSKLPVEATISGGQDEEENG